jgi:uncharacterized membrane protein
MLHLIHPALVHFTVAFLVLGGACEAAGLLAGRSGLARWGGGLVLVGAVSLVPTIVSGYLAANTIERVEGARELLAAHERNGLLLLGAVAGCLFWKSWCGGRLPPGHQRPYALLLAGTVLLAVWGAWLGGRMVYAHGVGVLRP